MIGQCQEQVSSRGDAQKAFPLRTRRNPLDEDFKGLVEQTLEEFHVPGISVAVVDGDATWAEGYGHATLGPAAAPATPSTLYYAGSTTKAFLAALFSLMIEGPAKSNSEAEADSSSDAAKYLSPRLAEKGWQTPISRLIRDDFVLRDDAYAWAQEHLTLEDALSHRTGFPRHDQALAQHYPNDADYGRQNDENSEGEQHPVTVRDIARSLRHLPMTAEPRAVWRYCNYMYLVASHAAEVLTGGRWLGDTLRAWIWEPLGMRNTYLSLSDAQAGPEHLANGYAWDHAHERSGDGGGGYTEVPFMSLRGGSGAGGIVSNVRDYARWARCLLREAAPLSEAGHAALRTPRMVVPPEAGPKGFDAGSSTYALGWFANTYRGWRVLSHGGGMEAYGTEVFLLPDLDFAVITMGNTANTSNAAGQLVAWKLIYDRLGVPEDERLDWKATYVSLLIYPSGTKPLLLFSMASSLHYRN